MADSEDVINDMDGAFSDPASDEPYPVGVIGEAMPELDPCAVCDGSHEETENTWAG